MNLKSQFQHAILLKDRQTAQITDKSSYIVVRTPNRPDFFWGNYIIMPSAPTTDVYEHWLTIFESEIGPKSKTGFVAITWDGNGQQGDTDQFTDKGFELQTSVILSASCVHAPPKTNPHVTIRPLQTESDFEQTIDVHFTPNWEYSSDEDQILFLQDSIKDFRKRVDTGNTISIGAFLDNKLTAVVEMYYNNTLCVLDSVATHRDYRRQKICSTLTYYASQYALTQLNCQTLALEADAEYHAAAIYESIGFQPTEKLYRLQWCSKS
ncbi:MAG: GNAT family N-acetyltransferase [Planctomycetota bacterium]|jgi:GNAT superfamily N-acetyltransferase